MAKSPSFKQEETFSITATRCVWEEREESWGAMKGTWWPSVPVYRIYTKWILCLLRSLLASSNKLSISKSDTRWDSLWLLTFSRLCDDLTNSSFVRKWEKCPWLKKLLPLDAPEAAFWFLDASQMNQITTSLTFKALSSPFSPFRVVGSIKRVICYFGSPMQLGHSVIYAMDTVSQEKWWLHKPTANFLERLLSGRFLTRELKRFSVYALRAPISYLHCLEKWPAEEKEGHLKCKMSACHCNYSSEDKGKGLTGWSRRQSSNTYTHLSSNRSHYRTHDESLIEVMAYRKQPLIKPLRAFGERSLAIVEGRRYWGFQILV